MEAAVSANSKCWLGFGRQRGVFGTRKLSLLSSIGVGCSRKMMRNNMNCMRRFPLESTSMGMGMGPRAAIERRQSFNLKGRFVRAEAASAASGSGGEDTVENGDVMLPQASIRVTMQNFREAAYALGGEVAENGDVTLPRASIDVAMQYVREAASALGGEDVKNGDVMLPRASIDVAMQYVRPACLGIGGVMFGFGYYLGSKITNVVVMGVVMAGICVAITLLEQLQEVEHSRDRNPNSGGGNSLTAMVPLTSVLQYVGINSLTDAMAMFVLGCFLRYVSTGGITSALLNAAVFIGLMIVCWLFEDNLSFPLGDRKSTFWC